MNCFFYRSRTFGLVNLLGSLRVSHVDASVYVKMHYFTPAIEANHGQLLRQVVNEVFQETAGKKSLKTDLNEADIM